MSPYSQVSDRIIRHEDEDSCPRYITVLPPFSGEVKQGLAERLQSYTMNLSLFLKPAAYQVADVVLSVSRDC